MSGASHHSFGSSERSSDSDSERSRSYDNHGRRSSSRDSAGRRPSTNAQDDTTGKPTDADVLNMVADFMNKPKQPNFHVPSVGCLRWSSALASMLDKSNDVYTSISLSSEQQAIFSTPLLSQELKFLMKEDAGTERQLTAWERNLQMAAIPLCGLYGSLAPLAAQVKQLREKRQPVPEEVSHLRINTEKTIKVLDMSIALLGNIVHRMEYNRINIALRNIHSAHSLMPSASTVLAHRTSELLLGSLDKQLTHAERKRLAKESERREDNKRPRMDFGSNRGGIGRPGGYFRPGGGARKDQTAGSSRSSGKSFRKNIRLPKSSKTKAEAPKYSKKQN